MTTERIDHVAEVQICIDHARKTESANEAYLSMTQAQVHATLALVEQQRIANLIELARFRHEGEDDQSIFTAIEASAKWRKEAAEGLGLA